MNRDSKNMISIIIPCFNEAEGVSHLALNLKKLEQELKQPHEFIFVDDGSSDLTYNILKRLYGNRIGIDIKIIKHDKNRGVGGALKTGIANSKGEFIAVLDSDCTYEPVYLVQMFYVLKQDNADIITASPYHPKGSTVNVPEYRLFLSKNLSRIYNIISQSKFFTYTSMFRIYRAECIKSLRFESEGFLAMAEILIKAHKKGFEIIEFPATLKGRSFGTSNAKTLRMIKEHLAFITKILLKKV